jgi:hypothetical protein
VTDLKLLETIDLFYPHPRRLPFMRCWGCGEKRVFGKWWEAYQREGDDPRWGYLCSSCIVIAASMVIDKLHALLSGGRV